MIIIPIFDIGKQKIDNISKFFIKINNKFLIEYCLESIENIYNQDLLFIISNNDCVNLNIDKILKKIYKNCIINIIAESYSVLDTLNQSKQLIKEKQNITIYAPPFTYFSKKINLENYCFSSYVLLFKSNNPEHCYVKMQNNKIVYLKEKNIIGNYALLGLYRFRDKELLFKYIDKVNKDNKKYLSDILKEIVNDNLTIEYSILDLVYPFKNKDYIEYIKKKILRNEIIFGISCDHSGFKSKNELIEYFISKSIKYIDYGCYTENDCDYQDFIYQQYKGFLNNEFNIGISFCRSGQGVNISANQTGFFSAIVYDKWSAQMAIEHNNCNFLCLSERLLEQNVYSLEDIINIIHNYKFLGGRFLDRLIKIDKLVN